MKNIRTRGKIWSNKSEHSCSKLQQEIYLCIIFISTSKRSESIKNAFSDVKPVQIPHIPFYFGGASSAAVPVGAKHSNVYAMWGEPIAAVKERIREVKAAAPKGHSLRFSVSLRPILGDTEEKAWEKARSILSRIKEIRAGSPDFDQPGSPYLVSARPQAVGSNRLLQFAQESEIYDKRLWTPIAAATGAYGNNSFSRHT